MNIHDHALTIEQAKKLLSEGNTSLIWTLYTGSRWNYGLYGYTNNPEHITQEWLERGLKDSDGGVESLLITEEVSTDYYLFMERKSADDAPLHEQTKEEYWEMLEILPPLNWHTFQGNEVFFMSEFTSGRITTMHCNATVKGEERYFCKQVHFDEKDTWITNDLIQKFDAKKESKNASIN